MKGALVLFRATQLEGFKAYYRLQIIRKEILATQNRLTNTPTLPNSRTGFVCGCASRFVGVSGGTSCRWSRLLAPR